MNAATDEPTLNLLQVPPGGRARMHGFNGMSSEHRQHLRGYGLTPGCMIEVLQHSPVTVIKVDETELALDKELARQVEVDLPVQMRHRRRHRRKPRRGWFRGHGRGRKKRR